MKLLPVMYALMASSLCTMSWSMDKLDKDISVCETEINRMSKERSAVLMNDSISMDAMIQVDKAYSDALQGARVKYDSLKQKKINLQKQLGNQAKL